MGVFRGKQRLPVRLVMIPLSAAQAAERIRKARNDRDKRLNHSKIYYKWLHYAVFITNIEQEVWTAQQVAEAYKMRWQIEIIFNHGKVDLIFSTFCKNNIAMYIALSQQFS